MPELGARPGTDPRTARRYGEQGTHWGVRQHTDGSPPTPRNEKATVSTSAPELEANKSERLRQVAQLAEAEITALGVQAQQVEEFLNHYFRHVDATEVLGAAANTLLGMVRSHFKLAGQRSQGELKSRAWWPTEAKDGFEVGRAVVQLVNDDMPFLVDTVSMEVLRQGWNLREVFHPQFVVRRDSRGRLLEVVHTDRAGELDVVAESWIQLELVPPLNADPDKAYAELESGLRDVRGQVAEAVQDWQPMKRRMEETVQLLQDSPVPYPYAHVRSAMELLNWLSEDHFTFLGYREYRFVDDGGEPRMEPVPGTGLGVLRGEQERANDFHALPATDKEPQLVVVTKGNHLSRVHRPAYLDYIGVRVFGDDGEITGERRFLGLFSATAYTDSVTRIPGLKDKARRILEHSGFAADSHGAKSIRATIESYPRDELFQGRAEVLAPLIEQMARLRERRQVRLFIRRDHYGRFVSCMVFLPRDRYTTKVRTAIENILIQRLGGESVTFEARANESVLARLHFVVRMPVGSQADADIDIAGLQEELTDAARSWDDSFAERAADNPEEARLAPLAAALPEGYKEDFTPRHALMDLSALAELGAQDEMAMVLYVPDEPADWADLRLKVFRRGKTMTLSEVLPHLSRLGVSVTDERPYEINLPGGLNGMIYDFGLGIPGGGSALDRWTPQARDRFMAAFRSAYFGESESDRLNGLVTSAELTWRQVEWLRTISRYLQQAGSTWSQEYIAQTLLGEVDLAAALVELFAARFDPAAEQGREERVAAADERVGELLEQVDSLDHDRILRAFWSVIRAIVRTNAFRKDRKAVAIKLLPRQLDLLPEPRPAYEIFVCSPTLEGVHLRFGEVARGGLRWSDRREDFRTEVLGLVKAQMVKNTVIVPVGAKGGFYPKQLPDPTVDRGAWFEAGRACYQIFVNSLLDVTDNIVDGELEPPTDVVRHDGDDPYLVVAADKGTATFSDTANEISVRRGFWLGDAFASGGSVGYDHKAMGITARGAWVSVRRHFREMGVDCQNEDFSCVGIGDMSGDVFGNGMLLSKHIRLVAAFNHQHIFLDPDPDPEQTWVERKRLFDNQGNWGAYDTSLISTGGGIHSRQAKSIPITDPVRQVLGLDESVTALAPNDLVNAILKAPVDLLWNGGIGTYVKASSETNAQVGDKANDPLRVNGNELRCKAVGEGGNLGLTQLGRIEYATAGGRINTDFIDNSAGVDTSDHEVNIKILLSGEVAAGRLSEDERVELLESMTDEVAELVLAHNYDQNLALANAAFQSASMAGMHERWMQRMEEVGLLDRRLEAMPDNAEMERRIEAGRGLTLPELSTLLSYTKILLEQDILASDLPDDPYLADRLLQYFPKPLRDRFAEVMPGHRLHREIITTVAVNRYVNSSGSTACHRLSEETGASPADVIRAQLAARSIFRVGLHEVQIARLDNQIDAAVQARMRLDLRRLVERGTRWLLAQRNGKFDVQARIDEFVDGVQQVKTELPQLLVGRGAARNAEAEESLLSGGVPAELAQVVAATGVLHESLPMVQTARAAGRPVTTVARVHFLMAEELALDTLLDRVSALPRLGRWDDMARAALREDLQQVRSQLTAEALAAAPEEDDPERVLAAWSEQVGDLASARATIESMCGSGPDLARLSVGLRQVRTLLNNGTGSA
ncbi:NAD-glutamate dehydrogenase [Naumannella sp. ID2617S]|nr:NAD-glutamate dehydrogenase [Naumannella sp. ID2617S]